MAKKEQEWTFFVGETSHTVNFISPGLFNCAKLYVDGYKVELKQDIKTQVAGIDVPILTEYADNIRFVYTQNKADIAVDGIYMTSGLAYVPLEKISRAGWVFALLCWLPIIFVGGLLGGLICGMFCGLCFAVLSNRGYSNKKRTVLSALVTLSCIVVCAGIFVLSIMMKNQAKTFTAGSYSITLNNHFTQENPDEIGIEDAVVVFGAYPKDIAVICIVEDKDVLAMNELYFKDVPEYLDAIAYIKKVDTDIMVTENNTYYITFTDYVDGDNIFCIASAVYDNDAFWLTQMVCDAKLTDKYTPSMLQWIDSVTIAD